MGRGDKRTEKGKRFKHSHGVTRPKGGRKKAKAGPAKPVAAAPAAAPAKKTTTKK